MKGFNLSGWALGHRSLVVYMMIIALVVAVERSVIHPIYKKVLRRVTKLKAHDEGNVCKVGDRVQLSETRPISKDKHWRVVRVMVKGQPEK